ncbi:STAS domain-containing protein [Streptomyces sp. BPTC-684]|uniref:STAS domain-containing protein n=1 Tax=Streptomyces sp. BPTC-684 TaxID=3043734 RepID=UPI0024B0A0CC|nr:STAS domain-containing protein [Streptomyces sp. BPTC-684]WHM40663.1 STAS domain-containing protein [Streptomyces sp. BPTC-684]
MPLPQLNVYRHDRKTRALITLAGEIDLATAPLLQETLARCLRDGIRTVDVDLIPVTFCDCTGLNTFLEAAELTTAAGGALRLHYPSPALHRLLELTGSTFLLHSLPDPPTPTLPRPGAVSHQPVPVAVTNAGGMR